MAHRFATKIHSILTRSIIRPVNNNVFYSDAAYQCTKNGTTRYPINQQNANTYIETLKRSQGLAAVAGGSETTCTLNENVGQWINGKMTAPSGSHYVGQSSDTGNRFFSSKTDADAAAKSRHDKCVNKKEECKSFELCNCDQNKEHMCGRQQYVFKVCQKRLAPYPSFSEACYEEPPKRPDECKCPWPVYAHPTFKPQKKKFHTCCRRFAPKEDGRNNEKEATPSEMVEEEEEHREPKEEIRYPVRVYSNTRKLNMIQSILEGPNLAISPPNCKPIERFPFKTLPEWQTTPKASYISEEADRLARDEALAKRQALDDQNAKTLQKMIMMKDRFKVHGPQICHKVDTCGTMEKRKCKKKPAKPAICPEDLLDNRTYKKYRDALKHDNKKKHHKHGHHKHGHHNKGKHAKTVGANNSQPMYAKRHDLEEDLVSQASTAWSVVEPKQVEQQGEDDEHQMAHYNYVNKNQGQKSPSPRAYE